MNLRHILQESWRGVSRNRTEFSLSTSVQAVCLTLLTLFFVITLNLAVVVRTAGRRIEVHAFLTDDADPAALRVRIGQIAGVARTSHITKTDALEELREELGADATLIDALEDNPLPTSIRIALHRGYGALEQLEQFEAKVSLLPGVAEVWSGRESLNRLDRLLRAAIAFGVAILIIVSLSVVFIAFQTAENSIVSRRREIDIMELVGASRMAVRSPFMIEATAQGLIGGLASFVIVFSLSRIAGALLPRPVFPTGLVLAFTLGLGSLLGLIGSLMALNRTRT